MHNNFAVGICAKEELPRRTEITGHRNAAHRYPEQGNIYMNVI